MENPFQGKTEEQVCEYILASALEACTRSALSPESMPLSTQAAAFEAACLALTEKGSLKQRKYWAKEIPRFQKLCALVISRLEDTSLKLNRLRAELEEDAKRPQ